MGYSKQLFIRTTMSNPKKRIYKLDLEFQQSLQYLFKQAKTAKQKRKLIKKTNPFFYAFGEKLVPFKHYMTYEENYGIE